MRCVIFGTGKMYQDNKDKIRRDVEVVAFIDNQQDKWGGLLDGIRIYPPGDLRRLKFDFIFLLSIHHFEMRKQLLSMGIPKHKIYCTNHMEILCEEEKTKFYGDIDNKKSGRRVLIFSHALTSTGAQNVMSTAISTLNKKGYQIVIVSGEDGELKEQFRRLDIPVIIMWDIYSKANEFYQLARWADKIIVNTLFLYYIVEELLKEKKDVLWWIHETGILEYLDEEIFRAIARTSYVSIYAVSPLVKRKVQTLFGFDIIVNQLIFGIPRYILPKNKIREDKKIVFAVIGGIGYIKGQDIYINAVKKLRENIRNRAEFWIVGGGKLPPHLLADVGDNPCFKITGQIAPQNMREIYSQINVVVCSSREDAMSVVVAEGCMNEKIVIVSDSAGIAEFIEDGKTGMIFESENVEQLTELMAWIIENYGRAAQIGRASKQVYKDYFTMDIFEKHLLAAIGHSI